MLQSLKEVFIDFLEIAEKKFIVNHVCKQLANEKHE